MKTLRIRQFLFAGVLAMVLLPRVFYILTDYVPGIYSLRLQRALDSVYTCSYACSAHRPDRPRGVGAR